MAVLADGDRPDIPGGFREVSVAWVTFQFNDLTCRTREHLQGVPGECFRTFRYR
jgi:hypothetical protein